MNKLFEAFTVGACILGTGIIYGSAIVSTVRGEAAPDRELHVLLGEGNTQKPSQEDQEATEDQGSTSRLDHPGRPEVSDGDCGEGRADTHRQQPSPSEGDSGADRTVLRGKRAGLQKVDGEDHGLHVLVKALISVESGGLVGAIGDQGEAVGLLQIHRITVRDVNRILGWDKYTYADRLDPIKSVEMFEVSADYYCDVYKDWTFQGIARRWNGGPTGHRKRATLKYWQKVKAQL